MDRDKVIKGLECCQKKVCIYDDTFKECPYWELRGSYEDAFEDCTKVLAKDALALLKAREARVMTLDEVKQHNNQDGCVWFEQPTYNAIAAFVRKEDFEIEVISPYILGEPINHGYWTNGNYGKTWRCWTSRPTDEQREAIPWN